MTAQDPDILINEHPRVDLRHLELYHFRGVELPVLPQFPESNPLCTSLWRGYIATFHLTAEGTLHLTSYDFPHADPPVPQHEVTEGQITGDFWLIMRPFFFGPNVEIPFRDGRIVEDSSKWLIGDQTLHGRVARRIKNAGLLVDVGIRCFMPRSLLPAELRDHLDKLIGLSACCEIHYIDHERGNFIVRPTRSGFLP